MIVEWVVSLVLGIVQGLLSLLPTWEVDTSAFDEMGTDLASLVLKVDAYVPVVTLLACFAIRMGVWVFMSFWRALVFVYDLIPFKAT